MYADDELDYEFGDLEDFEASNLTTEELEKQLELELELGTLVPDEAAATSMNIDLDKDKLVESNISPTAAQTEKELAATTATGANGNTSNKDNKGSPPTKQTSEMKTGASKIDSPASTNEVVSNRPEQEGRQSVEAVKETNQITNLEKAKVDIAAETNKNVATTKHIDNEITTDEATEIGDTKASKEDVKRNATPRNNSNAHSAQKPWPRYQGYAYNMPSMLNRYPMQPYYNGFYMPHMPPFPMSAMPYQPMRGNRIYVNPKFQQERQQQSNAGQPSSTSKQTAEQETSGSSSNRRINDDVDVSKLRPVDTDKSSDSKSLDALRSQAVSSLERRRSVSDKHNGHHRGEGSEPYSEHFSIRGSSSRVREDPNSYSQRHQSKSNGFHLNEGSRSYSRHQANDGSQTNAALSQHDSPSRYARTVVISSTGQKRSRDNDPSDDNNKSEDPRDVKRRYNNNDYAHNRPQSPARNSTQPERIVTIRGRNAGHILNTHQSGNITTQITSAPPAPDRRRVVYQGHDPKQDIRSRLGPKKPYERRKSPTSSVNNEKATLLVKNVPEDKFHDFQSLCPKTASVVKNEQGGSVDVTFSNKEEAVIFRRKYNRFPLGQSNIVVAFK